MKRFCVRALVATCILAGAIFLSQLPFGPNPNRFEIAQSQTLLVEAPDGWGSGIVVTRTNSYGNPRIFVWTAAHVIGCEPYELVTHKIFRSEGSKAGKATFIARVLKVSPDLDIALLWVDAPPGLGITGAEFAGVAPLRVGTPIFHVSNFLAPLFDGSVSTGIISQLDAHPDYPTEIWHWALLDQTDCTVIPGSSGGGIFTHDGRVVGIVVAGEVPTLNCFVPNRVIAKWAREHSLEWALYGEGCPTDYELEALCAGNVLPSGTAPF